ncbi:hypothetical cytosolic protein [Syntrophus aciditrophicus SB]|uniref:Hypothetical cytosolic protein n=1 Tax=Syntrophus aciditrophicus (strain SB) TaxID=56780 RepID=Q2LT66_SYNAS|nr:hypothetical cytosolic protein [Syntrophus aciditrophicus SB]
MHHEYHLLLAVRGEISLSFQWAVAEFLEGRVAAFICMSEREKFSYLMTETNRTRL